MKSAADLKAITDGAAGSVEEQAANLVRGWIPRVEEACEEAAPRGYSCDVPSPQSLDPQNDDPEFLTELDTQARAALGDGIVVKESSDGKVWRLGWKAG